MKLYADQTPHFARQLAADAAVLAWVLLWIWLGTKAHAGVLTLAAPGRKVSAAGSSLGERLREAGGAVGGIPYVGDDVARPFDGAGGQADQLAAAGRQQVELVGTAATWVGVLVALLPVLLALAVWLPRRVRFVRTATAGARMLDAVEDLDLFALRALGHQPLERLAAVSPDPAGAWRRGDPQVTLALARLELDDVGLALPPRLAGALGGPPAGATG
jgi:hypothetical protein